ncbi:subtilisin family serine protease [Stackebrandtia endophytica]|uniref:Subtilisin family serine protease n=1 Tax=Stackebrandtia endophytica TaxID=1496996 RepID=A0A543AY50_9ACTN|nr:S8 family peptidase [Stackebrandtia endophytica]TQL77498.1 subtilisin family serine protease [Stackebrandtia endophytica]
MTKTRTRLAAAVGVAATAAIAAATLGAAPAHAEGTVLGADAPNAIAGEYIVVLNDGLSTAGATGVLSAYDGKILQSYDQFNGYFMAMSADEAKALAADPSVAYVEQNGVVEVAATQTGATWGLDRLDQDSLPLDQSYTYPDSAGEGVTAYIIDTGADLDHPEFEGRMTSGRDTVDNDDDAEDCQGHGTHVAGTIGGAEYGVAKNVDMVAVRVLDCNGSGSYDGVIAGIEWVTANAQKPAVANMSLGGGFSQAINDAVAASVDSGVTYAVAAGNENSDACSGSPSSTPEALTVGATDNTDARASFSNYGTCVDIFAPGVDITAAWLDGGENTISGTSMASPHVAGVAALHLGENPDATPADVSAALVDNAVDGAVTNPGTGSPNKLLNIGYLNDGGGDPGEPGEPGEPGDCEAAFTTATPVADGSTVETELAVECETAGTASVSVDITHSYRGDLSITLVSPDGTSYELKTNSIVDSADDVKETYSVDVSGATASGTWTLVVQDHYFGDTGTINGWTMAL